MIDTIIFRIHDLELHKDLTNFLQKSGIDGTAVKGKQYDTPIDPLNDWQKKIYLKRMYVDYNSGKEIEFTYRAHLKSSHYDLAYEVNTQRNFIEFNFSIPKYLFGTNVFQFVPHHFDKGYVNSRFATIKEMTQKVYDDLRSFLKWFFKKEFSSILINFYSVQIKQIDICYNKIFNTPEDAAIYFNDLKKQKKKFMRNKEGTVGMYDTSIAFKSEAQGHYKKIYMKGEEFKKHDRNKMLKNGFDEGFVNKVHDLANRMLRYEVSFRTKYMSDIFKGFIFRSGHYEWKLGKEIYKQLHDDDFKYKDSKGDLLDLTQLTKYQKKCYKYAQFYDGKVFHFYLESDSAIKVTSSDALDEFDTMDFTFEREQRFDFELFNIMTKQFLDFKKEFTISNLNTFMQLLSDMRIGEVPLNKRSKHFKDWIWMHKHINIEKAVSYKLIADVVEKLRHYSWSEMLTLNKINRSSFYAVRKFFKDMGMENPATIMVVVPDEQRGAFLEYQSAIESIVGAYYVKRFIRPF